MEETTIGDCLYKVTPLPARQGIKTMTMLLKMVGPVFAAGGKDSETKTTQAFAEVIERLTAEQVLKLCEVFGKTTVVIREDDTQLPLAEVKLFDLHFASKYGDILEWLSFCIEVNYGSFLGSIGLGGLSLSEKLKLQGQETDQEPSQSPETSTGSSGS